MLRLADSCALLALALLLALAGGPLASGVAAHAAAGHPARIQKGSCDALDGVAFPLTGVGATISLEGTPIPTPEMVGASAAGSLDTSDTILGTSLSDLVKGAYAIVIYESDEAMDHIIACGDVGGPLTRQMAGMVMPGDELAIWLSPTGDSGTAGLALLQANGDHASLRIFLAESEEGGAQGDEAGKANAAEATPAS